MPTSFEATRLNLEYFRKQAKALLKNAQAGDRDALVRLETVRTNSAPPALHDAQLAIAREQGFASWPRLRGFIRQSELDFQGLAMTFVEAALGDLRRALEILQNHPTLADANFHTALVFGDPARVEAALDRAPEIATAKGGPRHWEPLLYVCFSRFASRSSTRAAGLVETAQTLLARGATPDCSYVAKEWPDYPLSCLYGATGINNNLALARVLLEAGANPNDGESVYHSTEHADLECLRLLLVHGASVPGTNALKHMLDREDIEGTRLLLESGADPNEVNGRGETALHWAVWRGRSPEIITLLINYGVPLDAVQADGRTAYAMAMQRGQQQTAALLAASGASTVLSELDRFVAEAVRAAPDELSRLLQQAPPNLKSLENAYLIPDLANSHGTDAVRVLLAAGLPVDARGEMGATALHWACWKGYPDLAKLLLEAGASLVARDSTHHGTPADWLTHGLNNCGEGGDYAGVARLLLAAGAVLPPNEVPTGNTEVDAVLREYRLID